MQPKLLTQAPDRLVYHLFRKNDFGYLVPELPDLPQITATLGEALVKTVAELTQARLASDAAGEPSEACGRLSRRKLAERLDDGYLINVSAVTKYLNRIEKALKAAVDTVQPGLELPLFDRGDRRGARLHPNVTIIIHEDTSPPEPDPPRHPR